LSSLPRRPARRALGLFAATALLTGALASATPPASAATRLGGAKAITPSSTGTVAKSASSRLAQSDPAVLATTGTAMKAVMVKLDYDSLASYAGDAAGRGATSPSVTGRKLDLSTSAAKAQQTRIGGVEQRFRAALAKAAPSAKVGRSFRTVYGGISLTLPADRIKALATLPGVVAVQDDTLNKPLAISDEAAFIGAATVYRDLGSNRTAGAGVLIADLDTGIWPEHPSFAARADLPAAPTRPDGSAFPCNYGDNPLTPAADPFVCNNKLVSGQDFLQTYTQIVGDQLYPGTARDDDGHGTHTSSTAGGNPVAKAELFGVDRGPVQGIAPGAQIAQYRVCGPGGCFGSDTTAATEQAVLDGADVISYSISGGSAPFADPTELAFLDAYAAGTFVSASAGNSGPTAGTTDHLGPWVTTVAASTQSRAFVAQVTLKSGADQIVVSGSSLMPGTGPHPVVRAESLPGEDAQCQTPAPPGSFTGKIVVCVRGVIGRVAKGLNVSQGGAAGMILENAVVQDTETDNHFLPAVHLDAPAGSTVNAFLASHPDTMASFTAGSRDYGHGDVMAGFSSRGPRGGFLKPDVTATGVQVLAGNTPTTQPDMVAGTYFQAIAGTSMSAPHVSGAAALLKAQHPTWTPGQIKSALATTALQKVVKEDGTTPADPFDFGSGRIDLTKAGDPGLTFDASAAAMVRLGTNPAHQVDLNLPSVYATAMPGKLATARVARNVTDKPLTFDATGTATDGARIVVKPSRFTVPAGGTTPFTVEIDGSNVPEGTTVFGQVDLTSGTRYALHLPVVFTRSQGDIALTTTCPTDSIKTGASTTCTVTAENTSLQEAPVTTSTSVSPNLTVTGASAPATVSDGRAKAAATLKARLPDAPTISDGNSPFGYNDLADFGVAATAIGDEAFQNYTVPQFTYHGQPYSSVGVTSDGYVVVGGAAGGDVTYLPQTLPDPAAPNNVLAPFWSDLDGGGDAGIRIATLSDGVHNYLVVQADEHIFGTTHEVHYQIWIGTDGAEDISFAYDSARPITPDASAPYVVGVENADGSAGQAYDGVPPGDAVVASTPGAKGGILSYGVTVRADRSPYSTYARVTTELRSPLVRGRTIAADKVRLTR